jgi:hypothetical protein
MSACNVLGGGILPLTLKVTVRYDPVPEPPCRVLLMCVLSARCLRGTAPGAAWMLCQAACKGGNSSERGGLVLRGWVVGLGAGGGAVESFQLVSPGQL